MQKPNLAIGLASAGAILFIWSSFFVFSRAGAITNMTPYDIAGLRFIVAGVLVLPFAYWWWPRHLSFVAIATMTLCGPGAVYSIMMFHGLTEASAAYGGVFANGSLPIFTMIVAFALAGERPTLRKIIAAFIILAGAVLLGWRGMNAGGESVAFGLALFLTASLIMSMYIYGVGFWNVSPFQALAIITVPNALIYVPIWIFFLPKGLFDTELETVLFHALYQGVAPGFLAVVLFALAAIHLGPAATAGFSAIVPATATLLAIPVLGEVPTPLEWVGIGIASVGLALLVWKPRERRAADGPSPLRSAEPSG